MKTFVTGATGFIGSAIVQDLLAAGHEVVGLARSDSGAAALKAAGAQVLRGSLEDLDILRAGAQASEGVIHTAFIHDFSNMAAAGKADWQAIEAMGAALAGTGKPLVVTSGTAHLGAGRQSSERQMPDRNGGLTHRIASEDLTVALAENKVRSALVRLPPSVHGDGDHAFVPALVAVARKTGVSAYIGDGANRWPAVHRLDAARLFRLVLEKGTAGGRYHGVADEGVAVRDIAALIGQRLGMPLASKAAADAPAHFGWLAGFLAIDCPSSSEQTRRELGWHPTHPGLIRDLEEGSYFR
jgi:nucleoside-diphosphate-sugar epimerase